MLKKLGGALALVALMIGMSWAQTATEIKIPPSGADDNALNALKKSPRHGEWVDVDMPGSTTKIHTWVVYPERPDKAPIVLVIHDIYGMGDWLRGVTDTLAEDGFIALAPDFVSGKGPNGGGAESLGNNVNAAISKLTDTEEAAILDAVRTYGLSLPSATQNSACVGFCWGGTVSFMYATHQAGLKGAVVFYGAPPKPDAMAKITCPVLGGYGGNDARVTSMVPDAVKNMASLNKSYTPHIYDGAGHGFIRTQDGANGPANLKAAQQAWPTTIEFLRKNLEQPGSSNAK